MIVEISGILAGIPAGRLFRRNPRILRVVSAVASGIVPVLLFLLGASLDGNEDLLARAAP